MPWRRVAVGRGLLASTSSSKRTSGEPARVEELTLSGSARRSCFRPSPLRRAHSAEHDPLVDEAFTPERVPGRPAAEHQQVVSSGRREPRISTAAASRGPCGRPDARGASESAATDSLTTTKCASGWPRACSNRSSASMEDWANPLSIQGGWTGVDRGAAGGGRRRGDRPGGRSDTAAPTHGAADAERLSRSRSRSQNVGWEEFCRVSGDALHAQRILCAPSATRASSAAATPPSTHRVRT